MFGDFLWYLDISWIFLDFLGDSWTLNWNSNVFPFFWGGEKDSDWVPGSKTLECIELMRENGHKSSQVGGRCGSGVARGIDAV
jgi:hypothetical protein